MKKTQIIKYVVISSVTLLVILPFSVATLAIKFPVGQQYTIPEKKADGEIYKEIVGYWTSGKGREELVKSLAPLMDAIEDPLSAVEYIKEELGVDLMDVVSILEDAKNYNENQEN